MWFSRTCFTTREHRRADANLATKHKRGSLELYSVERGDDLAACEPCPLNLRVKLYLEAIQIINPKSLHWLKYN
jgi:hypothetical protein